MAFDIHGSSSFEGLSQRNLGGRNLEKWGMSFDIHRKSGVAQDGWIRTA